MANMIHKYRVYVSSRIRSEYGYICECGLNEVGFIHREYARDAWREAHGLDPIVNYPLV